MHYGVLVQDFWKGSVIIKSTLVQQNCNFGIYIHAKEPPKERLKISQRSLNNLLAMEKAHKNDRNESFPSEMLFNRGMIGTLSRRGTQEVRPSIGLVNPPQFNISSNSNQATGNALTKTRLFRKTVTPALM